MNREERAVVAQYIKDNPRITYPAVARVFNLSYSTVCRISAEFEIRRPNRYKAPLAETIAEAR
jgi:hypothetical protein